MRRTLTVLLLGLCVLLIAAPASGERKKGKPAKDAGDGPAVVDIDLDALPPAAPPLEELGYWLSNLSESDKSRALNVLADLASDSRLDRETVGRVLKKLVEEGSPPEEFGYRCPTCFQKRLSNLLGPLRLQGPTVPGPREGLLVLPVDDRLLRRMRQDARDEVGGTLPGLVKALLDGYPLHQAFVSESYARYHARGADPAGEPAFFLSAGSLRKHEEGLKRPLDAYGFSKWSCLRPPRRFDPGFVLLSIDPSRACTEVRIPTAADTENPDFRPTPASEQRAGRTCGGAPEWVCPNIPLSAVTGVRFVANSDYVDGFGK